MSQQNVKTLRTRVLGVKLNQSQLIIGQGSGIEIVSVIALNGAKEAIAGTVSYSFNSNTDRITITGAPVGTVFVKINYNDTVRIPAGGGYEVGQIARFKKINESFTLPDGWQAISGFKLTGEQILQSKVAITPYNTTYADLTTFLGNIGGVAVEKGVLFLNHNSSNHRLLNKDTFNISTVPSHFISSQYLANVGSLGNKVFMFGLMNSTTNLSALSFCLDLTTNTASAIANTPLLTKNASVCRIFGNKLFIGMGLASSFNTTNPTEAMLSNQFVIYDPETNTYSAVGTLPFRGQRVVVSGLTDNKLLFTASAASATSGLYLNGQTTPQARGTTFELTFDPNTNTIVGGAIAGDSVEAAFLGQISGEYMVRKDQTDDGITTFIGRNSADKTARIVRYNSNLGAGSKVSVVETGLNIAGIGITHNTPVGNFTSNGLTNYYCQAGITEMNADFCFIGGSVADRCFITYNLSIENIYGQWLDDVYAVKTE